MTASPTSYVSQASADLFNAVFVGLLDLGTELHTLSGGMCLDLERWTYRRLCISSMGSEGDSAMQFLCPLSFVRDSRILSFLPPFRQFSGRERSVPDCQTVGSILSRSFRQAKQSFHSLHIPVAVTELPNMTSASKSGRSAEGSTRRTFLYPTVFFASPASPSAIAE